MGFLLFLLPFLLIIKGKSDFSKKKNQIALIVSRPNYWPRVLKFIRINLRSQTLTYPSSG